MRKVPANVARRRLLAGIGGLLISAYAAAQTPGRVYRVAYIASALIPAGRDIESTPFIKAYRERLAQRGFVQDRNLMLRVFFRRIGESGGEAGQWREQLIQEAVAWKPDLIQVNQIPFAKLAQRATTTIPVVFALVEDRQAAALVTNVARPEGNLTGASIHYESLAVKRLEIARELLPSARRIVFLFDRRGSGMVPQLREGLRKAGERLNFVLGDFDVADIEGGLCGAAKHAADVRADAIVTIGTFSLIDDEYGPCLATLQTATRVPILDDSLRTVEAGVGLALGEDSTDSLRRAADIAARILSGAKPSDVPVDFQMRVQLLVNARSARQLGLRLPQSILLRADGVVD